MTSRDLVLWTARKAHDGVPFADPYLSALPGVGSHALYRNFLFWVVRIIPPPKVIVELGTDTGVTTAHMAMAAGSIKDMVISVDIDTSLRIIENVAGAFGRDVRATFVGADSLDFLRSYSGSPIALAYLDTDHSYERVSEEFRLVKPMMAEGGIVCVDDILLHEGMRRFWDEVREEKLDLSELHTQLQAPHLPRGTGFGVILP